MILLCIAAHAVDGDTIRCADGARLRIAGIEANELHKPGCHLPVCPMMPGYEAKVRMEALIGGKDLRYVVTGKSYRRAVVIVTLPDGRDLACTAIGQGIALRWERYDRRRRLIGC